MKFTDWKEFILYGVGGGILFITAAYAAVVDIMAYASGDSGLFTYYSKTSGYNNLGIVFTLVLTLCSIAGLLSFIFYSRRAYRKLSQPQESKECKDKESTT